MASVGDDQIGRVLGSRYRLVMPVGTGASGTVFQADDVQLRRPVAVKLLHPSLAGDPSFIKRFRAEAQQAAALSHPNIMAVFDWGEDNGTSYLVLEYLAGGSLRAMLDRGRLLSPSQAVLVALEAARGLDYAHKRGVVHRDIKPANLLFGDEGRLRVADFGLARAISEANWTEPDGMMLGTARYASPEQATGKALTGKTDVYSLTLSIIEAVTGTVPFSGETTVATLMNRLGKLMPVSADLGPLAAVLERSGRPDPDERSDSAELARALLSAAEKLPRPVALPLVASSARPRDLTSAHPVGVAHLPVGPAGFAPAPAPAPMPPPVIEPLESLDFNDFSPISGVKEPDGWSDVVPTVVLARKPKKRKLGRAAWYGITAACLSGLLLIAGLSLKTGKTQTFAVPSMLGISEGEARNQVSPNNWVVDVVREKNDERAKDQIIRHEPAGGELKKGGTLTLWVSDGPTLSKLPELTTRSQADATKLLTDQKLAITVLGQEYDEVAAPDVVLQWTLNGQTIGAGTEVPKGTSIEVVTSKGPAPRKVPEIRSMNWEQAKAAVESVNLLPVRIDDLFSDKWPAGIVARIEPGVDTEVPRGTEVRIGISKGPDVVEVPQIYGNSLTKAVEILTAAGLVQGTIEGPITRIVIGCDPPPGTVVKRGTVVKLRLG